MYKVKYKIGETVLRDTKFYTLRNAAARIAVLKAQGREAWKERA